MRGFSLSSIMYIWIYIIKIYVCLCPAPFSYIAIHVRNSESHLQFAEWRTPVKTSNSPKYWVYAGAAVSTGDCPPHSPSGTGISHNPQLSPCVASGQTAQKTLLPIISLFLRTFLLLWERDTDCIEDSKSLVTVLFHTNGRFFWLHNSYFKQIYHSIYVYITKTNLLKHF
jgi:hypothetical protein